MPFLNGVAHILGGDHINIFVRTDPVGSVKPDKERSPEKIDGAVATIMALDRALRNDGVNTGSVYDERGILVL